MIIFSEGYGRLGNQLALVGNAIAIGIETNQTIILPGFCDYSKYFEGTNGIANSKIVYRIVRRIIRYLPPNEKELFFVKLVEFDVQSRAAEQLGLCRNGTTIVKGWYFKDYGLFYKYAESIRTKLTPLKKYRFRVAQQMTTLRKSFDVIVGVHMRKGDYRTEWDGIHFYEDSVYKHYMEVTKAALSGFKVAFVLCSDEELQIPFFLEGGMDVFETSKELIEDLYTLSCCDRIIANASTFSRWAAFYGKIPIYTILDKSFPQERIPKAIVARMMSPLSDLVQSTYFLDDGGEEYRLSDPIAEETKAELKNEFLAAHTGAILDFFEDPLG